VIGTVTAGMIPNFRGFIEIVKINIVIVENKTIARITTGSALPEGANAIVMVLFLTF
jgi:hypothetical protein